MKFHKKGLVNRSNVQAHHFINQMRKSGRQGCSQGSLCSPKKTAWGLGLWGTLAWCCLALYSKDCTLASNLHAQQQVTCCKALLTSSHFLCLGVGLIQNGWFLMELRLLLWGDLYDASNSVPPPHCWDSLCVSVTTRLSAQVLYARRFDNFIEWNNWIKYQNWKLFIFGLNSTHDWTSLKIRTKMR